MLNRDEIEARDAGKIRAESGVFAAVEIQEAPDARLAKVRIDQQRAIAKLSESDGAAASW
jgi:hypothetical protein